MIPPFDTFGNLPPGIYPATWQEFIQRFAYNERRIRLAEGLLEAMSLLELAGCPTIYINGSYVTSKETPGDFDACWEITGVNLEVLDPVFLQYAQGAVRLTQRFGGQLFPYLSTSVVSSESFFEFFQRTKVTAQPKGIVVIDLRSPR